MKPLSPRKRWVYLIFLTLLFCILVPSVLLYASGYRYKPGFGIVRTGGIILSVPQSDALVMLNGREIGRSGLLNKSFYIDDLAPSTYVVSVSREGMHPWYRTLVVEPQIVTGAVVLLVPEEIEVVKLVKGNSTSSGTKGIPPRVYDGYLAAFRIAATSTLRDSENSNQVVGVVEKGDVVVRWSDEEKKPSDNFCGRPSYCVKEISVERGKQVAVSVGFFKGGVLYATKEGGVFFSEVDVRPTPVTASLYPKAHADVRVVQGKIIIKDGGTLYEIENL